MWTTWWTNCRASSPVCVKYRPTAAVKTRRQSRRVRAETARAYMHPRGRKRTHCASGSGLFFTANGGNTVNIAENMAALVGNTPLVRLNRLARGCHAEVVAKLEFYNPCASVKDRIARSMIESALESG